MINDIKHFPVNWIDGMKISKNHFVEMENAIYDQVRDAYSVNIFNYNYGLLPSSFNGEPSLDMQVVERQPGYIKLRLKRCKAITPGGCRIEITEKNIIANGFSSNIEADFAIRNNNSTAFDVVIKANPFARKPAGQPDPEVNPPRHPFSMPDYQLHILPAEQVNSGDFGLHFLTVAKLNITANEIVLDNSFIPPSTSVNSHAELLKYYESLGKNLYEIYKDSLKIIQNVVSKNQNAKIAENVKYIAERVVYFVAGIFFEYRTATFQQPPIYLLNSFVGLASTIKVASDCVGEREKLIKYFSNWLNINTGSFDGILSRVMNMGYDHNDINTSFIIVSEFADTYSKLMSKLSALDILENPDEDKENIFISRGTVNQEPKKEPKRGWNIFAD